MYVPSVLIITIPEPPDQPRDALLVLAPPPAPPPVFAVPSVPFVTVCPSDLPTEPNPPPPNQPVPLVPVPPDALFDVKPPPPPA